MEEYDELADKRSLRSSDVVIYILQVLNLGIRMMEKLSSLPLDLVVDIISYVIRDPTFIKSHVSQSIQNSFGNLVVHQGSTLYTLDFHNDNFCPTELYCPENINLSPGMFRMVGSCNGLLCIEIGNQISLYNPVTQAHRTIPEYNLGRTSKEIGKPKLFFAYDCVSEDYKVLRFAKNSVYKDWGFEEKNWGFEEKNWGISFYSLSTNSWDIIENPPWDLESVHFPGVVANNSLYWMDSKHTHINSYDLFSRKYDEIHFPEKLSPEHSPHLAVLRGRLYIVTFYLDIWKLEGTGAQESRWTKIFGCHRPKCSDWDNIFKLARGFLCKGAASYCLVCSEDERKIIVARVSGPLYFICCDLELQRATIIEPPGLSLEKYAEVLPWAGTIVPLSD